MTRPRPVSFNTLAIHRPAPSTTAGTSSSAPPKPSFGDLLRRRGASAGTASAPAPALDTAPAARLQALPESGDEQEQEPQDEQDGDGRHAQQAAAATPDTLAPDWADALVPTQDMMETLLAAPAAARAARLAANPPHPLVSALAQTISRFCNEPAVDESEGWQVRIPLKPEVLPETTLELSVSSYWLQLRFETTEAQSRDLLFMHRDGLMDLLEGELKRQREIAITID